MTTNSTTETNDVKYFVPPVYSINNVSITKVRIKTAECDGLVKCVKVGREDDFMITSASYLHDTPEKALKCLEDQVERYAKLMRKRLNEAMENLQDGK